MVLNGPMNGPWFLACVEQILERFPEKHVPAQAGGGDGYRFFERKRNKTKN